MSRADMVQRWRDTKRPPGTPRPPMEEFDRMLKPLFDDGLLEPTDDGRIYLSDRGDLLARQHGYDGMDEIGDFIAFVLAHRDEQTRARRRLAR